MARTSKNTSKKTEVKEVKPEVKTEIVEEKKIDEPKTDVVKTDPIEDNKSDNVVMDGLEEHKNEDGKYDLTDMSIDDVKKVLESEDVVVDVIKTDDKTSIEEDKKTVERHNSAPRWAKDVYGYNWMGQCYDE